MAKSGSIYNKGEKDKDFNFAARLQKQSKLWQKKNENIQLHQQKLLKLWASGFFDGKYAREHLINLLDRGVFTIVPYLVEGDPKCLVETLVLNYKSFAYTTQLALNYLIKKIKFAESVLIPAAINSMFGAGITRIFDEYDRIINLDDEVIKSGHPVIRVIHDSDYIGDPMAKTRDDFIFEGDVYKLPTDYAKDLFAGKDQFGNQIADYISADCKLTNDFSLEKIFEPDFNMEKLALRDYTTFIDLYLYDENSIVTIMPDGKKAKILRTIENDGPESPYTYLGYKYFPGCSVPIPPAWFWHDQDVSINIVAKTGREQAESQKDVIFADMPSKKAAEAGVNAKNMDVIVTKDPKDGIQKISFGGINPDNLGWMNFVELLFNQSGGTPEVMRGTGAEAPTLGQERMIFQNASRIVNNMYSRFHNFMETNLRKLAWRVWTDPLTSIPVIKDIPGFGKLPQIFDSPEKVGDFYDFVFTIVPYSTQRLSPEMKYQRLFQFASQWILPTLPLSQQQGAEFDIPEATERMGNYLGFDDFGHLYKTAVPKETDIIPYTMQSNKNKGQMNDSFGSMLPSMEANSERREEESLAIEPMTGEST
jgi:hypothetical protein